MPRVVSFIVLVGILLFIGTMFFKVMAQFVLPLFLAAVLVVVFKPLHMRVRDFFPGRLWASAMVTTTLIMLVVLLPTAWLGWNAYLEGRDVFRYLKDEDNQEALVTKLDNFLAPFLDTYSKLSAPAADSADAVDLDLAADAAGGAPDEPVAKKPAAPLNTTELYKTAATRIGVFLVDIVKGMLRTLIGLIIMVLALFYFLKDGPGMIHTMMRLSPLDNEYERELLDRFTNVSRAVVVAVLASAVVQGLLAGIGFYFALAPGAPIFLLTAVTMVLAVVPFVGAAGVWIPTCLWIYFYQERVVDGVAVEGDAFTALVLAAYCGGVVSTIDNFIKPYVLHGQSNLHPLLALMSVLGGVTALGPVGILVGPMLVAFIHALLVMVNKELRLMSSGDGGDGRYQKSMFPINPHLETEAEGTAGRTTGETLEHLAMEVAGGNPGTKRPGPMARVRNAAKRRKRK